MYSVFYKKKILIYFCTAYVKNKIIGKTINTVSFRGWMETTFRRQNWKPDFSKYIMLCIFDFEIMYIFYVTIKIKSKKNP